MRRIALPSPAGDVLVLCYHAVSESWPSPLAVRPRELERQLEAVLAGGYTGATFLDALSAPRSARTLVVTFDDAFRSVFTLARPILERLGLVASVYAPTAFVGGLRPMVWPGVEQWAGGPHEAELACMSWDELDALARAGWEVGSHTCSHAELRELDDALLLEELSGSRSACERALRRPCRTLAYPYGDADRRVVHAAHVAGYQLAATLPSRPHAPLPLAWPRVGVYRADSRWRFRAKIAPSVRAAQAGRAVLAARRVIAP